MTDLVSRAGATGLMGIMANTAAWYQNDALSSDADATPVLIDLTDPAANIAIGVRNLNMNCYKPVVAQDNENGWPTSAEEQWKFAVARHNAGPFSGLLTRRAQVADPTLWSSVASHAPSETQLYVSAIFAFANNPVENQ